MLAYAATREPTLAPVIVALGALGGADARVRARARVDELLGWALALGGIAYTIALVAHGTQRRRGARRSSAPGSSLCGELATWSLDERRPIAADARPSSSRARPRVAVLALAGLAAGALVVALAAAPVGGGLAWTALGAAAAVLVVARRRACCSLALTGHPATLTARSRAHSSSGLGHRPLTAAARVRIPYAPLHRSPC